MQLQRLVFLFVALGSLTAGACSTQGSEESPEQSVRGGVEPMAAEEPAVASYAVALTVAAPSALPKCNAALAGSVAVVGSPPSLWRCAGGSWCELACTAGQAGTVAFDPSTQTLLACAGKQWTQVALPQGPQGPPGIAGATGPAGAKGERGPQGEDGEVGPQGLMGPVGQMGVQGPMGSRGDDGAQGPQGPQGPQGNQGPAGPPGPPSEPAAAAPKPAEVKQVEAPWKLLLEVSGVNGALALQDHEGLVDIPSFGLAVDAERHWSVSLAVPEANAFELLGLTARAATIPSAVLHFARQSDSGLSELATLMFSGVSLAGSSTVLVDTRNAGVATCMIVLEFERVVLSYVDGPGRRHDLHWDLLSDTGSPGALPLLAVSPPPRSSLTAVDEFLLPALTGAGALGDGELDFALGANSEPLAYLWAMLQPSRQTNGVTVFDPHTGAELSRYEFGDFRIRSAQVAGTHVSLTFAASSFTRTVAGHSLVLP